MNRFEIRFMPIDRLVPAPYNPRKILTPEDKPWRKLRKSIEEFGLVEPLIWNETTGHVVGGHMRLSILKHLNWTEAPVCVAHLSEAREKALNVILNNGDAQSRYDADKLQALLTELEGEPEFELTGFDRSHLDDLRFEPAVQREIAEEPSHVEITLEMSKEKFDAIESRLDGLVRDCDLVSHMRLI